MCDLAGSPNQLSNVHEFQYIILVTENLYKDLGGCSESLITLTTNYKNYPSILVITKLIISVNYPKLGIFYFSKSNRNWSLDWVLRISVNLTEPQILVNFTPKKSNFNLQIWPPVEFECFFVTSPFSTILYTRINRRRDEWEINFNFTIWHRQWLLLASKFQSVQPKLSFHEFNKLDTNLDVASLPITLWSYWDRRWGSNHSILPRQRRRNWKKKRVFEGVEKTTDMGKVSTRVGFTGKKGFHLGGWCTITR